MGAREYGRETEFGATSLAGQFDTMDGANMMPDQSFEDGVADWSISSGDTLTQSTDFARTGAYSMKLAADSGTGELTVMRGESNPTFTVDDETLGFQIEAGMWYRVKFWVKGATTASVFIRFSVYDVSLSPVWNQASDTTRTGTDWTEIDAVFGIPEEENTAALAFVSFSLDGDASAVYYVDDMQFAIASSVTAGVLRTGHRGQRTNILQTGVETRLGVAEEQNVAGMRALYLDNADPDDRVGALSITAPALSDSMGAEQSLWLFGRSAGDTVSGYAELTADDHLRVNAKKIQWYDGASLTHPGAVERSLGGRYGSMLLLPGMLFTHSADMNIGANNDYFLPVLWTDQYPSYIDFVKFYVVTGPAGGNASFYSALFTQDRETGNAGDLVKAFTTQTVTTGSTGAFTPNADQLMDPDEFATQSWPGRFLLAFNSSRDMTLRAWYGVSLGGTPVDSALGANSLPERFLKSRTAATFTGGQTWDTTTLWNGGVLCPLLMGITAPP